MDIEASILISAPPERVWSIATDPTLATRWNPNVVAISGFSGLPIQTGTRWNQTVKILGRDTRMEATVVECDPPHFGIVQLAGPGNPQITTIVAAEDGSSRLTQHMEIGGSGGFGSVAVRLARPTIERELNEALRRQKAYAEAAP